MPSKTEASFPQSSEEEKETSAIRLISSPSFPIDWNPIAVREIELFITHQPWERINIKKKKNRVIFPSVVNIS